MPVRRNGYYTDPNLAKAFDNLSDVFKTPSGTDVYGYTKSNAEREKAARLSDLYNYARSPDYDQATADRLGVAAGNYAPTQSYYAVDEGNDTSLKTNAASNAATLAVADKNNAGALARQYAQPVTVSDGQTVMLPAQTAAATSLPGMFRGNITANQGQTVTTPGGEVIAGAPKPLNDSEMKAKILGTLPENEQRAVALAPAGVAAVVGKDGPRNVLAADSVGQEPYFNDTRQAQVANYKTPNGGVGTASLDKDSGRWKDTQTGAELPAGSQTYTANLQGDKGSTGLGASTQNNIDGMLVDLSLAQDTSKQLRGIITKNPGVQGLVGSLRGTVQDVVQTGNEVGQLLKLNMDKMKKDVVDGRVDPDVVKQFANFDPNIPATKMLETLLTAQVAKVLDPNGRVSNDRYKQVSEALGQGGLTGNTQRTLATLDQLDKIIASRRELLGPSAPAAAKVGQPATPAAPSVPISAPGATAAPPQSAPVERWERGPDGQLRRAAQ